MKNLYEAILDFYLEKIPDYNPNAVHKLLMNVEQEVIADLYLRVKENRGKGRVESGL